MELFLDCMPCMHRQVLEAARTATTDEATQARIMDRAALTLARRAEFASAPAMAQAMHAIVRSETGVADPYAAVKRRDLDAALGLEPLLRRFADAADDPLRAALKVAATGNVMDSAIYADLDIAACVTEELERPFARCDLAELTADLASARLVLVLGDNTGETVFDKVLLAALAAAGRELVYAVREAPIINDATLAEAHEAGVDALATLVSSGSRAPGTILEDCTPEFRALFRDADVVISKGQGNFESLSTPGRPVYFLLKAKCALVAGRLGTEVGDYVLIRRDIG
ncbi:MAG: DUF89 family protein [Propionibacteriaceae bacterium]|nr:DUF89 family protein [Propionibacteriaceae bacterium]